MSYNYINNILLTHTDEIIKKNDQDEEDIIFSLHKTILKEIEIGLIKM